MKEFKVLERLAQLNEVLKYDSYMKETGKAGHFSEIERIQINQERGKLMAGNDKYCHSLALREKIEFVIDKINNLKQE